MAIDAQMNTVHQNKGHDYDYKYSNWHRNVLPELIEKGRICYCTDIDWIEWRNNKPVAMIECRRAIGFLKTCDDVIEHFLKLNHGFQFEVYARIAYMSKIKAYIVAIKDNNPSAEDYLGAEFLVVEIVPPSSWDGKTNIRASASLRKIGCFNQNEYALFLLNLE